MTSDPLLTLRLGSAWREVVYTANCRDCEHWTRVDLKRIAEQLGDDFPLRDLRPRKGPLAPLPTRLQPDSDFEMTSVSLQFIRT